MIRNICPPNVLPLSTRENDEDDRRLQFQVRDLGPLSDGPPDARVHRRAVFEPQKFDSYEEFNRWKSELLVEIARRGGLKWTK